MGSRWTWRALLVVAAALGAPCAAAQPGQQLDGQACEKAIDPNAYYQLSNAFLKEGRVLAAAGSKLAMVNAAAPSDPGQLWKFTPIPGRPCVYRITNAALGVDKAIDSSPTAPNISNSGNYTGQFWTLVSAGNGFYRLSNDYQRDKSLDTYSGGTNDPFLGKTGNFSGQFWKLTARAAPTTGTAAAGTTAAPTVPPGGTAAATGPTSGKVRFKNGGLTPVRITPDKDRNGNKIAPHDPITITSGGYELVPVNLGDSFDVTIEAANGQSYFYPKIYIVDLTDEINIVGNPPVGQIASYAASLTLLDYSTNYYGYDVANLSLSNPARSLKPAKVFAGFDLNNTSNYSTEAGRIVMMSGFTFSGNTIGAGDSATHMSAGYTSFSREWGASIAGSVPVKGVQVSGAVAYKSAEAEERSEENIFVYSREQKTLFDILVNPKRAALDEDFKTMARGIRTAADARALVDRYGTHFNTKVTYGGDRWYYAVISREQYAKFKSWGIDVKVGVSTQAKQTKDTTKLPSGSTSTTYGSKGVDASGDVSVSYSEERRQGKSVEDVKIKYRSLGGDGGFDAWGVTQDSAMPVAFESDTLDKLIDIRVFKDWSDPTQLQKAQTLVAADIRTRIANLPPLGTAKPAPRVYRVKLNRIEVADEIDDLNKNTKGWVKVTLKDSAKKNYVDAAGKVVMDGSPQTYLWKQDDWSTSKLEYIKGRTSGADREVYVTVEPVLTGGKWVYPALTAGISVDIKEKDDCINCEQRHAKEELIPLTMSAGQPKDFDFTADAFATYAAKGSLRFLGNVSLEPSDFPPDRGPLF